MELNIDVHKKERKEISLDATLAFKLIFILIGEKK